jgi:hypothetical protein
LSAITFAAGLFVPSSASAQQTINFFVGGFVPRDLSSRGVDDVLYRDYAGSPSGFLAFNFGDFKGATAGAEYLVGLGDFFDAGLSVGVYSRSAAAIDADFTRPNGGAVDSELRLRIVPFTATVRYLPLGHHDAIEPYIGAGVAIMNWRYTEAGDFVDSNSNIIRGTFTAADTTVAPVVLGGVRVPVGAARLGGEIRYQGGVGHLPSGQGFAGSAINLGGFNYLFTIGVRF